MGQVPAQVRGDRRAPSPRAPPSPRPSAMSCEVSAEHLVEQLERARQRVARDRSAEAPQHLLEHVVHVAAPGQGVRVGLELVGLELALDQPLDRAVGEASRARRPTGSGVWRTCSSAAGPSEPIGEGTSPARGAAAAARARASSRSVGAVAVRPDDVGQHPPAAALGPLLDRAARPRRPGTARAAPGCPPRRSCGRRGSPARSRARRSCRTGSARARARPRVGVAAARCTRPARGAARRTGTGRARRRPGTRSPAGRTRGRRGSAARGSRAGRRAAPRGRLAEARGRDLERLEQLDQLGSR